MKCGPRPSRAVVEAGASTQLRLKNELPMAKRVRSSSLRLAAGNEKALRPVANTVVSPPGSSSSGGLAAPMPRLMPRLAVPHSSAAARRSPIMAFPLLLGCVERELW